MLPKILRSDARIRALDDLTTEEMNALREAIKSLDVMDIDHVHESFLPWLAWWFRAEQWDDSWSTEQKRASVKEALVLFRYKGTEWAVERAIALHGFDAVITQWHQVTPAGMNGTFSIKLPISNASRSITNAVQATITDAIERNKRGSQHWDINYQSESKGETFIGGYQKSVYHLKIGPKPAQPNVNTYINCAPYITVYEKVEISVNE